MRKVAKVKERVKGWQDCQRETAGKENTSFLANEKEFKGSSRFEENP